jgi:nicotinamidase-related amidase
MEARLMSDALVVVDMQAGSFLPDCPPRYDFSALVERLNALTRWVRNGGGLVVWVHHDGTPGDGLEPGTDGWQILAALERRACDAAISKIANDSFLGTRLEALLREKNSSRVIITGWATDLCVDTTVRSCTARGFETWTPSNGHTVSDRPHLSAAKIIEHHNFIWSDLIAPGGAAHLATCKALMSGARK